MHLANKKPKKFFTTRRKFDFLLFLGEIQNDNHLLFYSGAVFP